MPSDNLKVQTVDLNNSNEKLHKMRPFDLSAENPSSVHKSSSKHGVHGFSAKKAPVFVYHETKSCSKIRVNPKRESSP